MRSHAKKVFYYSADANAFGGFLEAPMPRIIPSQASIALPAIGGHATSRTGPFNFEEFISCRAAYTRVSGRAHSEDGPWSILVTSVVEGLNIFEVLTAERVVGQISVEFANDDSLPRFSLAGSHFDGLRLGGCETTLSINPRLLDCNQAQDPARDTSQGGVDFTTFAETGRAQAAKLLGSLSGPSDGPHGWLFNRFGWMDADRDGKPASLKDGTVLCSLVDGVTSGVPGNSFGHVVEIPDFGRIFLGELIAKPRSLRINMFRAELGCLGKGQTSGGSGGASGSPIPP